MRKLRDWITDPLAKEDRRQLKLRAKRFGGKWTVSLFRFAFLVCMGYVILYPIIILITRSFRPSEDMLNPSIVWLPLRYTTENFKTVMQKMNFMPSLIKTLTIVTISTIFTIFSCAVTGYGLARYRLRLGKIYMLLVILSIIVPFIVILLPYMESMKNVSFLPYLDFRGTMFGGPLITEMYTGEQYGMRLYDTVWSFYLPAALGVGLRGGLFVLVYYQFFRGMPKELENAARIDGCGEVTTFVRVMLPNAGAPMLVTAILSFVWYWTDYLYGQYLFNSEVLLSNKLAIVGQTINTSLGMGNLNKSEETSVLSFSACLLFILPPLNLYLIAQLFFMHSVKRSGIVG